MRTTVTPTLVHGRDLSIITPDLELGLMFGLMEYDRRRHEQNREGIYEYFSKISWPLLLIQAGPESYLGIDGLSFFDLQFKTTEFFDSGNPILSRLKQDFNTPQSLIEFMMQCFKAVSNPTKKDLHIRGVISPEILHGLAPLIKIATDKANSSVDIDPLISNDDLIEIANQYNQILRDIEETISNWHSFQRTLQEKTEQWLAKYDSNITARDKWDIEKKYHRLDEKLHDIIWTCRNEINYLYHWAVPGQVLDVVMPITKIWISMYLAKIHLPNNTQKYLLLPPSIFSEEVKSTRWIPVDNFHSSFHSILKEKLEAILESQPRLMQRIDSICKAQNLFLKEDAHKIITRGYHKIREKQLIEKKYIEELEEEWQHTSDRLKK